MYSYIPERLNICPLCRGPTLKTCSTCNTIFICENGECQKPIIQNNYVDKRLLYKFLRIMGSAKTKIPCREHFQGGTETQSRESFQESVTNI